MPKMFTGRRNEKGHAELTDDYYFNGHEIRRQTQKVKGKAAHKTQKMQRIFDRAVRKNANT